jgi:hypothetical protein
LKVFVVGCALLAGCADIIKTPPEPADPAGLGDGRVLIVIGSVRERAVFPRMDQFSKIELTFERKDGPGAMSPVEAGLGETVISLSPGTWEVAANAYNKADPPLVAARAVNTLVRTNDAISGNTYFALAPAGTGPGTLKYTVAVPEGLALAAGSRIRIEAEGALFEGLNNDDFAGGVRELSAGETLGALSLAEGLYVADILLEANNNGHTAVLRESVVILPGLVTELVFAPEAADFLDPHVRAALTSTAGVAFAKTANNSSHTLIGAAEGSGINRTQAFSVAIPGSDEYFVETVYFTMSKAQSQTLSVGGEDAAKVTVSTGGTVDGKTASRSLAVITVDTADIADSGGERRFDLALGENGKTPVVYAVTITIPMLTFLAAGWPDKWIYLPGEAFDPAGLKLIGAYTDGKSRRVTGGYTVEGIDTASVGEKYVQIKKYGITAKGCSILEYDSTLYFRTDNSEGFTITVVPGSRLAFDTEVEADHGGALPRSETVVPAYTPPPSGYTVSPGRTVVLAPYGWYLPEGVEYEWNVDGTLQSSTAEYLSFAYSAFGAGDHRVTVTAKLNGAAITNTAETTVSCVDAPPQPRPITIGVNGSLAKAAKLFSVVAPGQFGSTSSRLGSFHGFGGFGGYAVFKFDHSVPRNGVGGNEIKVGGNGGVWTEPGVLWVSMDENGNGAPDDTWYELKGTHTFISSTIRRYAVTFRNNYTWTDNLGNGGTYPSLQRYRSYNSAPEMTYVGTRLDKSLIGVGGVLGYADVYDDGRLSLSNAIQVNGEDANLPFIDFVKIVTAIHYADNTFGERSTEAGTPTDLAMQDPDLLVKGVFEGFNYKYTFQNDSGYNVSIRFEDTIFVVSAGTSITKSSQNSTYYLDTWDGNVAIVISDGLVAFTNGPDE